MKLTKLKIKELLNQLGAILLSQGIEGEIGVVGGAAMVLAYDVRTSTKDIDAIFKPSGTIRQAAKEIAISENIPEDWLNDAVKGFLPKQPKKKITIIDIPGLRVWTPEPEYLLAMKAVSARVDTHDADDIKFLIKFLAIEDSDDVFDVVEKYYPNNLIPAKMKYFIQELFQES